MSSGCSGGCKSPMRKRIDADDEDPFLTMSVLLKDYDFKEKNL